MSDLISRSAVYKYLESKFNEYDISIFGNEFAGKILDGIDDIPTAFDVENYTNELERRINEELKNIYRCDGTIDTNAGGKRVAYIESLDLFKKELKVGGNNENNN